MTLLDRLKIAAPLAALSLGLIVCAAIARQPSLDPQVPAKGEAKAQSVGPNKLLFVRAGHLTLIDPDGKNEKKLSQERLELYSGDAKLSPDGKQLAVLIQGERLPDERPKRFLHVRGLDDKEPGTNLGVECHAFAWSPDGTEIVCDCYGGEPTGRGTPTVKHILINVKTKEKSELKLPDNHFITDWSRDGKFFLTRSVQSVKDKLLIRIQLMNRDGTVHKTLADDEVVSVLGNLSPDGKYALFTLVVYDAKDRSDPPRQQLTLHNIETGKCMKVQDVPLNAEVRGYCWSPDGKRIAYTWLRLNEGKNGGDEETESFLMVCDPDGKNQKTIASEKGQEPISFGRVDWR